MNKLLQKVAKIFLGLSMAAGVGVAVRSNSKEAGPVHAAETTAYTLSGSSTGSGTSYNGSNAITQSNVSWTVNGNVSMNPWRIGGNKNNGLSSAGAVRIVRSTGAVSSQNISKVVVVTAKPSSNSINPTNVSLKVGTSAGGSQTSSLSNGSWAASVTFNRPSGADWSSKYFEIDFTMPANNTSTQKFITFTSATFYYETYTISYNANGGSGTMSSTTGTNPAVAACTFNAPSNKQFSYWHTTSSGTGGTTYAAGDTPKKDLSLYAIWEDLSSDPSVNLSLTSGSSAYKGSTVTVSATTSNLEGSGLTWTVEAGTVTGISSSNSSFSGTLASIGTVTIKAQDNGGDTYDTVSVTVNAVTVSLSESAISVAQSGTSSLTATVNTGSVIWSSDNAKVTVEADSGNALKGNISVAADATVGSTAVITATSTIDSSVKPTCTVTVSENPFASLTKVDDAAKVSTSAVYALSNEGTFWAGLTTSSSGIVDATDYEDVGFFKLESTTGGYYLKFVVKNAQTGAWEDKSSNKYVNNSSSTNIAFSGTASSVWAANYDATGEGVILQNTSNDNRFLGWNSTAAASGKIIKAYATQNLHDGSNNAPVYLYEVPQNKLDGLTVSGQTTTFTAGSTFSLGNNAVLTAHYSNTGNTTDLSGGTISYKINNVTVTTSTFLDHDTHNGQSVVITYTDAAGDVASATAYTITVNYKPAGSISLNIDSAPLSIGGTVSLTATVGDEYADENDVSWSTTSAGIASISAASGTKTITVTGVSAGSATITATANGHSATCAISVTADPILNLKDSGDNIINDETLEYFTGDTSVTIMAVSENVASPVYSWENEDDSVVTIDAADEYCEVTIVGGGSSEVSVTVGSLTRVVTFSITQSGVTSLSLTSSVPSGELYNGTYNNTLTLTPAITKVGNATGVINWSTSDNSVVQISNASTTAPTGITVTGKGAGTATITATSAYTPSRTATFEVSVSAEGVKSLTWASKPSLSSNIFANETTLGDAITAGGGYGTFTAKWQSEMPDTHPTFGTTSGTVHFALYDTTTPSVEGTPLAATYIFQKADNGKYIVPFYEGKRCSHYVQVTVTNWRSVTEVQETSATITWPSSGTANVAGTASATVTNVQYTYYESGDKALRLGTGSGGGQLRIDTTANIVSVQVTAKAYSSNYTGTLTIGDRSVSVTDYNNYTEFDAVTLGTPTKSLTISTASKSVRLNVQSIVIVCRDVTEIGKTSDCLTIEEYIDTYLHMEDYTSSQGWCKDNEHNYYGKNTETGAKYHFNQLSERQRKLLSSNSAYAAEWARLSAWAAANGETLNASTQLAAKANIALFANVIGENTNTVAIIVIISMVSVTAIGGYFFLRKRKEEN